MSMIPTGGIKEIIRVLPPKGSYYPFRLQALQKALDHDPDSPVLPFLIKVVHAQESAYQTLITQAPIFSFQEKEPFFVIDEVMLQCFHQTAINFCEALKIRIETKNSSDYSEILKAVNTLSRALTDSKNVQQYFEHIMLLDLEVIPAQQRLFILAAMQVTLHFAAASLKVDEHYLLEAHDLCPCCKMPAISSVLDNSEGGLRYLYCSFCETKWHVVRSTCTECASNKSLFQTSMEALDSPMSAEVCGECNTYLKFLDRTKTLIADPFIEDLLTLPITIKLTDNDYHTFSLNPYFV